MWWAWHFGLFCKNLNATFSKGKSPNRLAEDPQNMIYLDDPASRFFICGISVMELIIYIIFTLICASPCRRVRREDVLVKLVCLKTPNPVLYTAPHNLLDSVGLIWSPNVTNCHMVGLVDSAGFRWSKCWLLSRERGPVDSTGLCPPESTGMGINSQV